MERPIPGLFPAQGAQVSAWPRVFSNVATDERRTADPVEELKHDVAVAAQEERVAQAAVFGDGVPGGSEAPSDDGRRRALLVRWRTAAHALAVALENLERAQ